ncbi:MAG: hypothetical protein QXQ53_08315, partial [Candidatus Methanosuratincola sp.]
QHTGEIIIPSNGDKIDLQAKYTPNEKERSVDVEIPISEDLALLLPASSKFKVKHGGRIRYAKSEDLRSLIKSKS